MSRLNSWKISYAVLLVCAVTAIALPAQTLTTLFTFSQGIRPSAPVIQATDGNLYGTTSEGGTGAGMIFTIATNGSSYADLYNFCAERDCRDGEFPYAGLVQAIDGTFFGTTGSGGEEHQGNGAIFKITSSGKFTLIYDYCAQSACTDGEFPDSSLLQAVNGNFYGTTYGGGTNHSNLCDTGPFSGCGTVYELTTTGARTTIHNFCSQSGCTDGSSPNGALIQAPDGNFYGTTTSGGNGFGGGTVFRLTPSGNLTTLYTFCSQSNCADGEFPDAALIQARDGSFYGTTNEGGANGGGTVFKITAGGTLTTLHSFCSQSNCADGQYPVAPLIQATDGNFYGTTSAGGSGSSCTDPVGCGTVFEITPAGTMTTLYSFCSRSDCLDGWSPYAALMQDTNGNLYGTTVAGGGGGGPSGSGTLFSLSLGLGPFVETQPSGGRVGADVNILGTNLTGTTSVTFNGTPATFIVEASSVIKATVPAGATTGTVQVVTPTGTLSSNVPFRVAP